LNASLFCNGQNLDNCTTKIMIKKPKRATVQSVSDANAVGSSNAVLSNKDATSSSYSRSTLTSSESSKSSQSWTSSQGGMATSFITTSQDHDLNGNDSYHFYGRSDTPSSSKRPASARSSLENKQNTALEINMLYKGVADFEVGWSTSESIDNRASHF
jgi:hypothetical protein